MRFPSTLIPKIYWSIPGMGVISQGRTLKDAIIKIDILNQAV